jgi:hypothetical protein
VSNHRIVHGIDVDPKLPRRFEDTPNDDRPASHQKWWHRPYIETYTWERMSSGAPGPANVTDDERARWFAEWREKWFQAWPSGVRYDVRCLDGGAWDRPTCWGMFQTLDEAVACAQDGPRWKAEARS